MNKVTKIAFLALSIFASTLFFACNWDTQNNNTSENTESTETIEKDGVIFSDRTEGLNYIFSTDFLADITLTITRTEWNNLLAYYDQNYRNEEYIHADFKMKKRKKHLGNQRYWTSSSRKHKPQTPSRWRKLLSITF